jgi:hypothetical protein
MGTYSEVTGATALSTCSPCLDSENALPAVATYVFGNYAPEGSTKKSACVNTKSKTCSNVPMGAELLFDQYLTCGECIRSCDANNMLTGTCTDAGTGTTCTPCVGACRMDMTFSTDLYMTETDFSAATASLFLEGIKDSMKVPLTNISVVSITQSPTPLVRRKYITVEARIKLSNVAYLPDSTLKSHTPAFIASALKTALINNGLTAKVADLPWADSARYGTHFTDKGTLLGISQPTHTKVEGILSASPTQPRVQMKVELSYTKASFDETAQAKFKSAVANSVSALADNIFIKSVTEVTSSRRVSRMLLAMSVQVDFYILVMDEAASKAMVSNGGLEIGKLNAELAKQVFPSQTVVLLCIRLPAGEYTSVAPQRCSWLARVLTASCPLSKQGLSPISKVLTKPETVTAEMATTTPKPAPGPGPGLSSAHRVVPAWGLQVFFGILAAMLTKKLSGAL